MFLERSIWLTPFGFPIFVAGAAHAVDSSDIAFRMAAIGAMRQGKLCKLRQGYSYGNDLLFFNTDL